MENKNKPAMPFECVRKRKYGLPDEWVNYGGLTKREMFAMAAMQGLLVDQSSQLEESAHNAVVAADLLLRELDGEDVRPVIKYVPVSEDMPY